MIWHGSSDTFCRHKETLAFIRSSVHVHLASVSPIVTLFHFWFWSPPTPQNNTWLLAAKYYIFSKLLTVSAICCWVGSIQWVCRAFDERNKVDESGESELKQQSSGPKRQNRELQKLCIDPWWKAVPADKSRWVYHNEVQLSQYSSAALYNGLEMNFFLHRDALHDRA